MSAAVSLPLEIGGSTYRLTFKFGTMRVAERELGRPITSELASGEIGLDMLSALFWAVLQPSHLMTRDASDDLIDVAGVQVVAAAIAEGLGRYFAPDVPSGDADQGEAGQGEAGNGAGRKKPKG